MLQLRTLEGSPERASILDVLPAALGQDRSPARCLCRRHDAVLTEPQRAAHERVHADWRLMRIVWCDAHGYRLVDLLRAERAQQQPYADRRQIA